MDNSLIDYHKRHLVSPEINHLCKISVYQYRVEVTFLRFCFGRPRANNTLLGILSFICKNSCQMNLEKLIIVDWGCSIKVSSEKQMNLWVRFMGRRRGGG